jgi:hypothetical protein
MNTLRWTALGLLLLLIPGGAFSQTPRVDAREHRQTARIRQGVRSGELTRGETRRLAAEQGKIRADEKAAKADGHVTPAERRHLTREQNRANRHIAGAKHNARHRE